VRSRNVERRREVRRDASDAERVLWQFLRGSRLGAKFRRQHPIGPFVVDFYCCEARLVVEVDGGQHYEPGASAYDERRTAEINRRGHRVVRFRNDDVLRNPRAVVALIAEALRPAG
jgi:adenine-specific DNA-methyltransferase